MFYKNERICYNKRENTEMQSIHRCFRIRFKHNVGYAMIKTQIIIAEEFS